MFKLIRGAAPATHDVPSPDPQRESVLVCGWFDSSHDLKRGLLVHEHESLDEVSELLPLPDWLELHLSGWQPQA